MDESLQNALKELPAKAPRSKLEPYQDLIFSLLEKNWRYRDIAALLRDKLSISVAPSTLHNFVRVRTKQKQRFRTVPMADSMTTNPKSEERLPRRRKRTAQTFEFTPGEALKLSPKGRKDK